MNSGIGKWVRLAPAGLLLLAGCIFRDTPETAYFDLPLPEAAAIRPDRIPVVVSEFRNESGSGVRFQLRRGSRIEADPANKWVLPPGALLTRSLTQSLAARPDERRVSGTLLRFEADLERGRFLLAGTYRIDEAAPLPFAYEEPFGTAPTPAEIVEAAEFAARFEEALV